MTDRNNIFSRLLKGKRNGITEDKNKFQKFQIQNIFCIRSKNKIESRKLRLIDCVHNSVWGPVVGNVRSNKNAVCVMID